MNGLQAMQYAAQNQAVSDVPMKGTAVDSINANIESLTNRMETLTRFASRVTDGLIGAVPPEPTTASIGPRPVVLSTQEHLRALEAAFDRLALQVNRLG
jgi:hypothetical protein